MDGGADHARGAVGAHGAVERLRGLVDRARRAPSTIEDIGAELARSREDLRRLEEIAWAGRDDTRGGVAAVGDELHRLRSAVDALAERIDAVDGAVAAHATALHRAVAAPARRAAAAALRERLGPAPRLRTGLSIFTLCWNHAELLEASVRSGLAVLDALPRHHRGELLILDDASSDDTPRVAARLAADDARVRVIRSEENLGLALARTTLLHAASTEHAFQLDADNVALPDGVAALYESATTTRAALTYGNVIQVDGRDRAVGPISNEPPSPALFRSNYVDTMAITDVEAYRELGGWSADPLLEHVDDWAAVHRVAGAGLLIAFVPVLVGRYRMLETAFHLTVGDPRVGGDRLRRTFDPTGLRQGPDAMAGIAAVAYHPATGPLWATPEAVALDPALDPDAALDGTPEGSGGADSDAAAPRVLVVAPGGVGNLGDDAITVRGLERVRATWPDAVVDLVTDGAALPPGLGAVSWLGPLTDVLPGLRADGLDAGDLDAGPLATATATTRVGEGRWRPLEPATYAAAVFLGGGSLCSTWSEGLIRPRAVLGTALRHADVPYVLSGQGIGPLDEGDDTALVAGLLAGADAVGCRDEASTALAASLPGVDPERVATTGDDALGLTADGALGSGRASPIGPDGARPHGRDDDGRDGRRPVLVVSLRRADYVDDDRGFDRGTGDPTIAWARAIDALAVTRGWDVLAVAVNDRPPEPELATLARIRATASLAARWRLHEVGRDPRGLVAAVAGATAVATQSFHVALFGLAAGVPSVLVAASPYYVTKATGLGERTGLPVPIGVEDPDRLADALAAVEAATVDGPPSLAGSEAAVDAWWAARAGLLDLAR